MNISQEEQERIRLYLLGKLTDEEQRRQLEERLFTDDGYLEELNIAEEDLIEQYLHDTLSKSEREEFETHFLLTQERRRKLRFGKTLERYVSRETNAAARDEAPREAPRRQWWPLFFPPPLGAAVALLVLLAAGLGVWRAFFYKSDVDKGLAALSAAYRERRPLEARISDLSYAPYVTTRGDEKTGIDSLSLNRAGRYLHDAVDDNPGPASRHALGKLYLSEKKFDNAIEQFEQALKADPNNPKLLSDLGAALLEEGKVNYQEDNPGPSSEKFARALEYLNRALEIDGSLLEALFNRALSYQYMLLRPQAVSDWHKYLEKDSTSRWAEEARRNLTLLGEQQKKVSQNKEQLFQNFVNARAAGDDDGAWKIISRNRDLRGGFLVNRLIDAYLEAQTKGLEVEAGRNLELLLYAGRLETQQTDDRFISALAGYYEGTRRSQLSILTEARRLLNRGHEYLDQSRLKEAVEAYEQAKHMFRRAGDSSEAIYTDYPLGHCYLLQSRLESSLSTFQSVVSATEAASYRWLEAQALHALAIVEMSLNNYSSALKNSQRSVSISEHIGDTNGLLKTTHQLGEEYVYLNDYHKSLSLHQRSLALSLLYSPEPIQLWRNYFSIARPLHLLGLSVAAVEYQREALRLALEMYAGMPENVCRSYINLGLLLGSLHRYDEALQNVRLAFQRSEQLSDEKVRLNTIAYSSLQLGNLYRETGEHNKAIDNYNEAIRIYDELANPAFTYAAHKGKLISCLMRGGCPSVEEEMATTLRLFEQYRSKILEETHRNSFFDAEQNIYDLAIDYEYTQKNDSRTAYYYAEMSRARSLLDRMRTAPQGRAAPSPGADISDSPASISMPGASQEIQANLPEQVQVLQYAVLNNKVLAWVLTKDGFESLALPINSNDLDEVVAGYLKIIASPAEGNEQEALKRAEWLYDQLVRPLEPWLDKRKQLSIVPDKILNYLPFSALYSQASGKYLIEDYRVSFAPSSNTLIESTRQASRKQGDMAERVLSVGNPRFDRDVFPSLSDLPSARREAEAVAASYGAFQPLTGATATKGRVLNLMPRAEVIHLALHSVVDEQSPTKSKLLLTAETQAEESGVLYAQEVYRLKLPLTRLVVLSSCRSAVERYYGGEGMIGLARPFIAAHVPLVVASLWPVDSESTSELMMSFHRYRKNRALSTTDALRHAQIDMLGEGKYSQPYYWAAFVTLGGYANF